MQLASKITPQTTSAIASVMAELDKLEHDEAAVAGQMTLGAFVAALEAAPRNRPVCFDFGQTIHQTVSAMVTHGYPVVHRFASPSANAARVTVVIPLPDNSDLDDDEVLAWEASLDCTIECQASKTGIAGWTGAWQAIRPSESLYGRAGNAYHRSHGFILPGRAEGADSWSLRITGLPNASAMEGLDIITGHKPTRFNRYRHYGEHLALGFDRIGLETVAELLEAARAARHRWPGGGEHPWEEVLLWAANESAPGQGRILGVEVNDAEVVIRTTAERQAIREPTMPATSLEARNRLVNDLVARIVGARPDAPDRQFGGYRQAGGNMEDALALLENVVVGVLAVAVTAANEPTLSDVFLSHIQDRTAEMLKAFDAEEYTRQLRKGPPAEDCR